MHYYGEVVHRPAQVWWALTGIGVGTTLLHVALPRDCKDRYPRCGWRTSSVTLRKGAPIRDSSTVLSVPCVLNLPCRRKNSHKNGVEGRERNEIRVRCKTVSRGWR